MTYEALYLRSAAQTRAYRAMLARRSAVKRAAILAACIAIATLVLWGGA